MLKKSLDYLERLLGIRNWEQTQEQRALADEIRRFILDGRKFLNTELPAQLETIRVAWAAAFGVAPEASAFKSKKTDTNCDRCGVDSAGTVYRPKAFKGQLCRSCYDEHVRQQIMMPMSLPREDFHATLNPLWLKVKEHSRLTGEGMPGDMLTLGLVDWIEETLSRMEFYGHGRQ